MSEVVTDSRDGVSASGITASATVGPWPLLGGRYFIGVGDTGTAAGTLYWLAPDGNYYAVTNGTFAAAGTVELGLAAGTYKWIAGSGITLGAFVCQRVPYVAL